MQYVLSMKVCKFKVMENLMGSYNLWVYPSTKRLSLNGKKTQFWILFLHSPLKNLKNQKICELINYKNVL